MKAASMGVPYVCDSCCTFEELSQLLVIMLTLSNFFPHLYTGTRMSCKKSTHPPSLSYIPLWELACHILSQLLEAVPIREPFTLIVLFSSISHTNIHSHRPRVQALLVSLTQSQHSKHKQAKCFYGQCLQIERNWNWNFFLSHETAYHSHQVSHKGPRLQLGKSILTYIR